MAHVSDLHLGYRSQWLGDASARRTAERDKQLSKLVDTALKHEVDLFLIAGDLFDGHRPDSTLIQYVMGELHRLESEGVAVVTLPGNHDEITYYDSVYRSHGRLWPGLLITNPQPAHAASIRLNDVDVHLYGVAYTGGITSAEKPLGGFPRLDLPGFHIGLFHGSLDMRSSERSLPLASDSLAASGYDYVALGHYHRFQRVDRRDTTIVYCGSLEARTFSDPGCGYLSIVELEPGQVRLTRVAVPVRTFKTVEMPLNNETQGAILRLGDPDLALELVLSGVSHLDMTADQLEDSLRSSFYHLTVVDKTTSLPYHVIEAIANELSVRGVFVRRMKTLIAEAGTDQEQETARHALLCGLRAFAEVKS
ncbi:MAG TPA: DNA repair exonuclease [Bacillota bacterium]|nr:DNA repair exonuclease [Bacillota bacterium]